MTRTAKSPHTAVVGLCARPPTADVAYLAQKPAAIPLGDPVKYIAITTWASPHTSGMNGVLTALAHSYLPLLKEAGLGRYDADDPTVGLTVERTTVALYLKLAGHADASGALPRI